MSIAQSIFILYSEEFISSFISHFKTITIPFCEYIFSFQLYCIIITTLLLSIFILLCCILESKNQDTFFVCLHWLIKHILIECHADMKSQNQES